MKTKIRHRSSLYRPAAVVASAITLSSVPAHAATVWNVNIGSEITTSDNFVGAATENTANSSWNSVVAPLPKVGIALNDSTGTATSVTLDISAVNGPNPHTTIGTRTSVGMTGDEVFYSYLGGTGVITTMTFKGLSVGTHDLVVYSDWWWGATGNSYPINQTVGTGLTGTAYLNRPDRTTNGTVAALLNEDTSLLNDFAVEQGNWLRLTGLTPDVDGQLSLTLGGVGVNQGLSGFQLIAIPEPTSAALLGLGGLTLLRRRRPA